MSTLGEWIREANKNAEREPEVVAEILDHLRCGRVKWGGQSVKFTYDEARVLFARQGIDSGRFEDLCRLADCAAW